jgi:galactokinase
MSNIRRIDDSEMRALFNDIYSERGPGILVRSAPGRVNLIGEHTDYNDGYVLPIPLRARVYSAGRLNGSETINIYAADYEQKSSFNLREILYDREHPWANYPKGVTKTLIDQGNDISGCDILLKGDVPIGAGLSSSAAVEIATARLLVDLNRFHIDPVDIAYIGKKAENEFVGVQCGVMDQFVASLGREGDALFIDCRTNDHESIPLHPEHTIMIVNTMIKRELATSAYNERRRECEEGVRLLERCIPGIKALRDVLPAQLDHIEELPEPIRSRCRHVVTENARVLDSIIALKQGKMNNLGELMNASHDSLRDDYQVSCRELDTLVDAARNITGTHGARMTGAGFGGCTVNLVKKEKAQNFRETITNLYEAVTGIQPEVYTI